MKKALLLISCSLATLGYESDGNVLKLGEADFDTARQQHPNMLVKFFAPWCGHCKTLAPTYKEVADALNQSGSTVKLAEVDCTVHRPLCQKFQVKGYPTVHFFSKGVDQPTKYTEARTKQSIVNWVNSKVPLPEPQVQFEKQGSLLKLTSSTFESAKNKFDFLFVKFYAPWCGHCKNMAPTWLQLAQKVSSSSDNVAIAEVDCTQHAATCSSNGIQGYPTIKLFVKGNEPIKYSSARTLQAFTQFLQEQKTKLIPGAIPKSQPQKKTQQL